MSIWTQEIFLFIEGLLLGVEAQIISKICNLIIFLSPRIGKELSQEDFEKLMAKGFLSRELQTFPSKKAKGVERVVEKLLSVSFPCLLLLEGGLGDT